MAASSKQRGAALIVALLVMMLVAILATALSSDFLLMFRRVENQLYSEQAYAYLLGAEGVARAGLLRDMALDNQQKKQLDYLSEDWAKPQQFPTDGGWIGGQIEDVQARFNLNSLLPGGGAAQNPQLTGAQLQFIRLLMLLKLEKPLNLNEAQAITEAIGDWIDNNDDVSGLGGAESQYYSSAEPSGRAANRPMVSPSELMWVKGMTPEIYKALAPFVTVWPVTGMKININTASAQVLACLGDDKDPQPLDENEAAQIVETRTQQKYFASPEDLKQEGTLKSKNLYTDNLDVRSDYFVLNAQTEFQGHRFSLHSLLHRDSQRKTVRVIERTFGEW